MSVESEHPLYSRRVHQWRTIRDCIEGEDAVKMAGDLYLPRASGMSDNEYFAYKKRARWVNFTGRTLDGLHGLIFRRDPQITAPDKLKDTGIFKDIDRRGTSLYQFLSDATYDAMQTTFGGLLVDAPSTGGKAMNLLEIEEKGIRPYLRYYNGESIINWRYETIDGVEKLTLVVLREESDDASADEFSHDLSIQYRVLSLDNGVYRQRIFKTDGTKDENGNINYNDITEIPISINNQVIDEIPFVMLPSPTPEKPMLLDLAYCNIGHYQKSADYENGVHLTTIPTGYVTGHKAIQDEGGNNESIRLGGDSFLIFEEEEAKVGTLVFSGAGLTHSETALKTALSDMTILGSRLVTPDTGSTESGDSAKIHRAGENAMLATFAKNVSVKVTEAIKIMERWMDIEGDVEIKLCTDYDTLAFDPNALNALANLAEAGKLPMPYVFFNLRNGEYAPSDSDYQEFATLLELEQEGVSPLDEYNYWKACREGKKPAIPQGQPKPQPKEDKVDDEQPEEE